MADVVSFDPIKGIEIQPENIPDELKQKPRWLLWRWEKRGKSEKFTKPPYQTNGQKAKVDDPSTWGTFEDVFKTLVESKGKFSGIGFVLSDDDDILAWDLDHCIDPRNAAIESWAETIISQLNSYTEITPSGEGLRVFCRGDLPKGRRKKGNIECYKNFRFLTLTGNLYPGFPVQIKENNLETYETYLNNRTSKDDKKEVKKSKRTQLDFLHEGDWKGAGYPSQSEADLAYCRWLAEEENGNRARIDELFRKSPLYREKWDKAHYSDGRTYGQGTIELALQSWESQWRLTDLGNAKRFASAIKESIRFCNGNWYIWDGKRLKEDDIQEIYLYSQKVIDQLKEEARATIDKEERKRIWNHMLKLEGRSSIENMIKLTESQPEIAIRPEDLDKNLYLFNCENGIIDSDGRLKPHAFEEMITKLAPVKINPEAKCPTWHKFLGEILPDKTIRDFLQCLVGYSMTGDITDQGMYFCYGKGANGKSTFFHVMSRIFGDYFSQLPIESLMATKNEQHSTSLTDLRGVRFVLASEPEDGRRFNEALIKQITGGEKIVARRMHENFQQFESTAKLWIMGNHKPNIKGTDNAIWRRVRLIPFTVTIPKEKQDKELWNKLEEELEGIFMWCIEGLVNWMKKGLEPPKAVLLATEEYRSEMDSIQDFINEEVIEENENWELHSLIYSRYAKLSEENNERPLSSKSFAQKLREKNWVDQRRTGNQLYWKNVRLRKREYAQREM